MRHKHLLDGGNTSKLTAALKQIHADSSRCSSFRPYISFALNLSYCSTLSISISLIAACDQRFLFDLPIVFLSFSIFLACSRGSSVDRVSSMRTERPGVGRQLLRRPTKASTTTTTIITTDTGAAAPAVPAPPLHHHHATLAWPSLRRAISRFFFRGTLPFSKCAAALRVRSIFLCEIREELEPAVKKQISGCCCASKSAAYARWSWKLLSKTQRNFLSRYYIWL